MLFHKNKYYLFLTLLLIMIVSGGYTKGFNIRKDRRARFPAAKVYLKNGKVLIDHCKQFYLPKKAQRGIIVEGRKIRPYETDSIIVSYLVGIPYDSAWLFKIIEGAIAAYSPLPMRGINEFSHIQKEGAEIETYSDLLLGKYLKGNEKALSAFISTDSINKPTGDYNPQRAILEYNYQSSEKRSNYISTVPMYIKRLFPAIKVYLKSGDITTDYFMLKHHYKNWVQYWIDNKQRKIMPDETDSIIANFLVGTPQDSTWLFKAIDGMISAYVPIPIRHANKFTHIQKEGSEIKVFSRKLLENYLADNKKALSVFYKLTKMRGRTFRDYNTRDAILEYNFQTVTKKEKRDSLLFLVDKEKNINKKMSLCNQIIKIDSSSFKPYLILGDYELKNGNTEKAYHYYTDYIRYCNIEKLIKLVRIKIRRMKKPVIY